MDKTYFTNIERHCQITRNNNYTNIEPTRRINRYMFRGEVIEKTGCSQIPIDTLKIMVDESNKKYKKMTEKIIQQIQTSTRNGKVKYQALGWKHAKEIKSWCDENYINCDIVVDPIITRNKLVNIDIWHAINGNLYDDGYGDYGNQYLDFRSTKQNVVYIEVNKSSGFGKYVLK
jgi:hypothetical protein